MSRREDLDNAIWSDPDFEALSANATLLYLWSFTNPRCGMAGMYKVSHRAMTESKVALDDIPVTLAELAAAGFAFYEDSVLWVRTRVKHLRSRSPQMAKSVGSDLLKVTSDHPLRARFRSEYGSDPWLRDALKGAYPEPIGSLSEKPIGKEDSHRVSEPSRRVPGQGLGEGQGKGLKEVQLPTEFPEALQPHHQIVLRVLSSLAERQRAKAVSSLSLASTMMARERKPLVRCAYDFVAWADGKAQPRKDVLAGYRNWLDGADDLAGTEPLNNGAPGSGAAMSERDARRARRLASMESLINGGAA